MKHYLTYFLILFSIITHSQNCEALLQYGIYDYSSTLDEENFISKYSSTMSKNTNKGVGGKSSSTSIIPFNGIPIPTIHDIGFNYSSNSDFFKQVNTEVSKRNKYIKYIKTVNPTVLTSFNKCIENYRKDPFLVYISNYSTDLEEITINIQINSIEGETEIECEVLVDKDNFLIQSPYSNRFKVRKMSDGGNFIKIKRLKQSGFSVIIRRVDNISSRQIIIPAIVSDTLEKIPEEKFVNVYEGIVHNCNGHHLSLNMGFRLSGTTPNCDNDRPAKLVGRLALKNDIEKDNRTPVYELPNETTLQLFPKNNGKLVGYISSKPIENGIPLFSHPRGLRTVEEKYPKVVGYLFPL
jgi:hypothetical protein